MRKFPRLCLLVSFGLPSEFGGARLCRLALIGCSPFSGRNLSALPIMSDATDSNNEVNSPVMSVSNSSPERVYSGVHSESSFSEDEVVVAAEPIQSKGPFVAVEEGHTRYTPREVPRGGEVTCSEVGTSGCLKTVEVGTSRSKKRARLGKKPVKERLDTIPAENESFEDAGECSFDDISSERVPPPIPHLGPVVRPSSGQSVPDEDVGGGTERAYARGFGLHRC